MAEEYIVLNQSLRIQHDSNKDSISDPLKLSEHLQKLIKKLEFFYT
jgi:hypothetical protein